MYWIYVFINYLNCFILFNSCIFFFEFMYLLFLNTYTYYFYCFYVFIYYYFETCLLLYPFYDLMIFIYNPKELNLSSRKQYK